MCWCRMRSSIGLEIRKRTRKVNLSLESQQMRISAGRSHEFKAGADGLCDSGTAGLLCLSEKVRPYLNRDFPRRFHPDPHHSLYQHSIWYQNAGVSAEGRTALNHPVLQGRLKRAIE
jgi:hypothetical protein